MGGAVPDFEKQKARLENTKKRVKQREKMIKEKERMSAQNTLSNLGHLFVKTKLAHLDPEILIGALLEIAEKSKDEKLLSAWREKSQQHFQDKNKGNAISISFPNPPAFEIKEKLKEMNFKWNAFRGEYYGFGEKSALSNFLENIDHKIEIIK